MAIVFQDWLNANELRAYPIHDRATRKDVNGKDLPNDVLVDANIWIPRSLGSVVYLSSVGITARLVSLTLVAAQEDAFCQTSSSSSSSAEAFTPIAVVSITKPATRFRNIQIEPLVDGVGGWVSFGNAINEQTDLSLLFDSPDASQLVDRCVRAYPDIPLRSLGKVAVSTTLQGLVRLRGVAGSIVTRKGTRVIDGVSRDVALIGLDLTENSTQRLQDFAGVCGHRPQVNTCNDTPIQEINGVKPDCNGNIEIEFQGDTQVVDTGDGLLLDFPVGLVQVCGPSQFERLPLEGIDICETPPVPEPSLSSSSTVPEPESSLSSTSGIPSEYCEDFEGAIAELSVVKGVYTVQVGGGANTLRYVSQPGDLADQFAVDFLRLLNVTNIGDTYIVESTIRPRTVSSGEGHLIAGYVSENDFFFAGYTLRPSGAFPGGHFFIGQKSAVGPGWPAGLGFGYNFIAGAQFAPPSPLIVTDYRIHFQVINIGGGLIALQLVADWDDGGPKSINVSANVPEFSFNKQGFAGLGVVGSETEFDNFGINCEESSSSF